MFILGADVGSTNVKAALFDTEKWRVVSQDTLSYPTYYPRPGWAEQDPEDWWTSFVKVVRNVLSSAKTHRVEAIALSSQREGVVLLDGGGKILGRCIIWMDRRSEEEASFIEKRLGLENVYWKTGLRIDATFTATKLLWIKKNQPEIYEKAAYVLQPKDYIVYRLTGRHITDYTLASRTLLFDINKREWIDEFFEELGLKNIFPEIKWSWEVAGETLPEIAEKLGLENRPLVVAGSGDRAAESIGAGSVEEGVIIESTGTTTNVNTLTNYPRKDPKMRSLVGVHVEEGFWLTELGLSMGASLFKWFADNYAVDLVVTAKLYRGDPYELLSEVASRVPPGAEGVVLLPFFMGARAPWWKKGVRGALVGLTLGHTREHMVRALLESIAYDIRAAVEVLEELGIRVKEVRSIGGASHNIVWLRIKADVLKTPIAVPKVENAAILGDIGLALRGLGITKSVRDVSRRLEIAFRVFPLRENSELYEGYYRKYIRLVKKILEVYEDDDSWTKRTSLSPEGQV